MRHRDQVLGLLQKQIGNEEEVKEISETAEEVAANWVNPVSGGKEETNGLIYGLIQSGKTGVLTVTGAIGVFWFSLIWKTHPFELAGKGKGPR